MYDNHCIDMMKWTAVSQVNLDESQTAEQEEVRATLHKEQELLQAYQRRLHHRLQESMSKETELFDDESQKKLALLQEELLEVDRQFARARTEAESKVRARQRKELTDFQNQSHELPPSESFMNRTWGRRSSPFAGLSSKFWLVEFYIYWYVWIWRVVILRKGNTAAAHTSHPLDVRYLVCALSACE